MSLIRKLKPDRSIQGALIPLSMLAMFILASLIFGISTGLITVSMMLFVFAFFYVYVFLRTGNVAQLVISADGAFFGFMLLSLDLNSGFDRMEIQEFKVIYITGLIFFVCLLGFLAFTRKLKWRGREVLELAAETVEETGNGYTSRPRPVGKLEYNPEQVHAFARFASRHLIALPYYTPKNTTLVLVKMGEEFGRLLGLSGDYRDATWVNFDFDGEVSVHISQRDYLEYREPLAFDQLCASLGQVFIDFFDLYKKGEGVRAIDRMDDLRIGIFS
jgi:hypothetical protein